MKIIYKKGNALDGPELFLAHGCNNRGKMGSGIAKEIRERFPIAYKVYRTTWEQNGLELGQVQVARQRFSPEKIIFNCITQDGYGYDGKKYVDYDAIRYCIIKMNLELIKYPNTNMNVAMPMIGAGLGGGKWKEISQIIETNSTFRPVVYTL